MNSLVILLVVSSLAVSQASIWGLGGATLVGPANPGVVLNGPAAHASLIGPDGSHIAAAGQAGAVVAPAIPGGVVSAAVVPGVVGVGVHGLGLGLWGGLHGR
ncbi:hypothetical protein WA026_009535 [Henosepilachna vigintioctopunctata]|uniref:Uncharacterized protein n=1 Tax=Henosepilachna vigintioctopunctata TaxID=420089 RepID=A0AAW1TZN0_9CUCU